MLQLVINKVVDLFLR